MKYFSKRSGYCFRIAVPKDLQGIVGRRELRYSLRSNGRSEAREKAQATALEMKRIFRMLRKERRLNLTSDQIHDLVQKFLRKYIDDLEDRYLEDQDNNPIQNQREFNSYLVELDGIRDDILLYLASGQYHTVKGIADRLLKESGFQLNQTAPEFVQLCRGILRTQLQGIELEKRQMLTGSIETGQSKKAGIATTRQAQPASNLVSQIIEKYTIETQQNWRPKTKTEIQRTLRLFMEFVEDVPLETISRAEVGEFKQTLMKLPVNITQNKRYAGKTIKEILAMGEAQGGKTLNLATVGNMLSRVRALFEWARLNGFYKDVNPASKMIKKDRRKPHEARAPFTQEDLIKLFHSKEYLGDTHAKSFQFWLPVLGLYTGARINELCQLHLDDIRQDDGVWVFDINDEGEKHVKVLSSNRLIPIHPFILDDLKLVSWVEWLKAQGETRLFPELNDSQNGYGAVPSKWFNRTYKINCGIQAVDGRKKDFHSFRATFITNLIHHRAPDRMRMQIEGHAIGDMSSVYADPFPAKQLYDEVISKLDYGIDLSHLKNSRFVIKG
jgi:integrase